MIISQFAVDIAFKKISVLASECNKKQIFKFLRFKGWNLEELSTALIQDCILWEMYSLYEVIGAREVRQLKTVSKFYYSS